MRIRPSVALIHSSKILLLRYSYGGKDLFQLPGGNMDDVETMENTLCRELMEEVNLPIEVTTLALSAQVIDDQKKQATLHCVFVGKVSLQAVPLINPKETSALEAVWVELQELTKVNLYPSVGKALLDWISENTKDSRYLGVINQPWL